MEFYSTAAQVIPTLLIVAALQSKLLSWAADKYGKGGIKRRMGQLVMFSIGGSLLCEAIALIVLATENSCLLSSWELRLVVLLGCLAALLVAWRAGHAEWVVLRDAAKAQTPTQQQAPAQQDVTQQAPQQQGVAQEAPEQ